MPHVSYIGVDLAWKSDQNPSGLAAAVGDSNGAELVEAQASAKGLDAVLAFVRAHLAEHTVIAIDAPLIITNKTGQRACERIVAKRFGRYKAGAHPSNLTLYPDPASVRLAGALARLGFVHPDTSMTLGDKPRVMIEVYPHPAMVVLFGLDERLRYKKGTVPDRRRGLARLGTLLQERLTAGPPALSGIRRYLCDSATLSGQVLKAYEDLLDAVFCTYLALHARHYGVERNELIGDGESGYIVNPTAPLPRPSAGDPASSMESTPCPFCSRIASGQVTAESEHAVAFPDGFPVSRGHALVVPRRHVASVCELTEAEQADLWRLAARVRARLAAELAPAGFNIGLNDGAAAGQTVPHAHAHVIPRYDGDVPDPRGGVRWVIPEKAPYWLEG
jgi:predicted RNase H-like nuclease/diadenosine tetraphosphate (Ap4A) HIT family hydrolase